MLQKVQRLLEHKRFKDAAEMLQQKRIIEENVWTNPQIAEFADEDPGLAVSLFDLVKAFGEVLERIKGDPRTKLIPVVVLTSSREQVDVIKSYQLGVNSYIVKPVNFESFTRAVQELGMYWLLINQPPRLDK